MGEVLRWGRGRTVLELKRANNLNGARPRSNLEIAGRQGRETRGRAAVIRGSVPLNTVLMMDVVTLRCSFKKRTGSRYDNKFSLKVVLKKNSKEKLVIVS